MKIRILLFEDEHAIRRPLCVFLRARGYEVLDFPSPMTCTLVTEKECTCSRDRACADLVITDMKMPGMTGLELIRMMAKKGCHASTRDKIVISSTITPARSIPIGMTPIPIIETTEFTRPRNSSGTLSCRYAFIGMSA